MPKMHKPDWFGTSKTHVCPSPHHKHHWVACPMDKCSSCPCSARIILCENILENYSPRVQIRGHNQLVRKFCALPASSGNQRFVFGRLQQPTSQPANRSATGRIGGFSCRSRSSSYERLSVRPYVYCCWSFGCLCIHFQQNEDPRWTVEARQNAH